MYADTKAKVEVTCGFCGRALGKEFYFTCHVCTATYCYAHRPSPCTHQKLKTLSTSRT